ncbi:oxygenase MpaB family protein [Crossiella sp. CA198]|uniref:oxygenase MpaB family protein n=1 Tax=Crossiella sp. CA198 TaxID=3455607 RepID=UPI003F8D757E
MGAEETGLFGPDSVTWRVHSDPVLFLGGLRALFLQALHPLAMAGVAQHSQFQADPWGRLIRTAEYVGTVTYGSLSQAQAIGAVVRRAHRGLTGVEPETGQAYRVTDPELLLWVHNCEVDSFLDTARRSGMRLRAAEADAYLAEQVRAARLVGVPEAMVPDSVAALADYFARMRPVIRCTAAARRTARFLLFPPMPTPVQLFTPARPAWAALAALSYSLLPDWARRGYGLTGLPGTELTATALARSLRLVLLALPTSLRQGPHYRAAQARIASVCDRTA